MSHLLRKAALSAIGGSLLVATLGLAPAAADKPDNVPANHADERPADRHERSDRDGDADSDASTSYTEDTDTNDGGTANNVADDGDNAHPSGRDRSVENGRAANQGRSESDPDDDGRGPDRSNGGPDKPNGTGGEDLADQDGNNGCGNDDDFEDDNEGWCGRKPKPEQAATPEAKPATETQPCPDGSMERPCAEPAAKATKLCPTGSMTRPCHVVDRTEVDAGAADVATDDTEVGTTFTTADAAEHRAGATCPDAGDSTDDDMPASCELVAADEDDDDTEVLGMESSRGGAAVAETPDTPVRAQSAGGGLLANLASVPVVGSVIEGELPLTGISALSFLLVAMAATVIGLLLVRASRRTKAGATS